MRVFAGATVFAVMAIFAGGRVAAQKDAVRNRVACDALRNAGRVGGRFE